MNQPVASETSVLIVGAGPTGLALALSLARRGVDFRLVDAEPGPGAQSRAMIVHARTLELYAQYGWAEALVAGGVPTPALHLRQSDAEGRSREVMSVPFDDLGEGLSPYPYALAYPQDDHERFLVDRLADLGLAPEWSTALQSFEQDDEGVTAVLSGPNGPETVRARYLCGADGARSAIRHGLNVGFPGGTYDQRFYVADVKISRGFDRDLHASLGHEVLALMLPCRLSGMQRLIGLLPPHLEGREDLTFEDVRLVVEPMLDVQVETVNWFSVYRVHHRVADRFRVGHAFLLGDAGHIHSPAGGQGMNTGIGDALNLGWKLADVIRGRAGPALLDSYEPERLTFARTLVDTTDRAFTGMVRDGVVGELTRRVAAPLLLGIATRLSAGRHAIFRTVSQIRIAYPDSPLSESEAGQVHAGDRLPWTGGDAADNFAPLSSLDWQLHVYGRPFPPVREAVAARGLPLHAFDWSDAARHAGLREDAAYLIRPDGYVGLALPEQAPAALNAYLDRHGLRFS